MTVFRRLSSIALGAGELLRAEGEMLLTKSRRACTWAGVALVGALAICIGAIGILVAGTAALALVIGWIWSVAAVSAAVAVGGLVTCAAARRWLERATRRNAMPAEPRLRADEARRLIAGEEDLQEEAPQEVEDVQSEETTIADRLAGFAMKNPGVTAGAAFAAAALFGPVRTLKIVARGAMIAGIASEFLKQQTQQRPPAEAGGPGGPPWMPKRGEPEGGANAGPAARPTRPERPERAPAGAGPSAQ